MAKRGRYNALAKKQAPIGVSWLEKDPMSMLRVSLIGRIFPE
jgi:hypothetical protein